MSGGAKSTQPVCLAHEEVVMAENKSTPNDQNVEQFLNAIADERKRHNITMLMRMKNLKTATASHLRTS